MTHDGTSRTLCHKLHYSVLPSNCLQTDEDWRDLACQRRDTSPSLLLVRGQNVQLCPRAYCPLQESRLDREFQLRVPERTQAQNPLQRCMKEGRKWHQWYTVVGYRHTWWCFLIHISKWIFWDRAQFHELPVKKQWERVSWFHIPFSQFHNKRGKTKQNTQPLSLLQLVKTNTVQIELKTNHEASSSVLVNVQ